MTIRPGWRRLRNLSESAIVMFAATMILMPSGVRGEEEPPPLDVETWHRMRDYYGRSESEESPAAWSIGIYPGLGLNLGLPDGGALSAELFVSLTDGKSFSAFLGYGESRGPWSESHMVTAGWGGVRPLPVAGRQMGFHGSFVRYHRIDNDDHGRHDGLSIGTEFGAGHLALAFEAGAARSSRNHWALIAHIGVKLILPLHLPLSGKAETTS
jgi:hypothetical protein